jgi:CubicO group peptidase (beta-lactamase class C family)
MKTRASIALLIAGLAVSTWADQIDDYMESHMRARHIPGVSLAIIRDGKIVKSRGYGVANLELAVPATTATVYEIGSNTKQFTAAAIMLLVEERRIKLDDSVTKYFENAPTTWSGITIHHLLSHASGIQNHVAVPGYLSVFKTSITSETSPAREELLKMFFKLPLEFQPGETWAYDNTGYYLLGIIIEKVSGKSYWQFLEERIFTPLGMVATRNTDPTPIVPNRATGYDWVNNHYENRPVLAPFVAFSAGSILSTVDDMAKWDAALSTTKLLKRESLDQIWTATKTKDGADASFDYGFGWFLDRFHGHRLVQHSGGTPGFSSLIYRFIDDKLTIVILTNHSDCIIDPWAIDLAGLYVPELKKPETFADPDPNLTSMIKQAVADLFEGKHDPKLFTGPMQLFLNTATGKAFWQWFASHGKLGAFELCDAEEINGSRVLRYHVSLGEDRYWLTCKVTRDRKIAQIHW